MNTYIESLSQHFTTIMALAMVQIPAVLFWHFELTWKYTGSNLTNGFMVFDGLDIYHLLMYANWIALNASAFILLAKEKSTEDGSK